MDNTNKEEKVPKNFIEHIIDADLASGKRTSVVTRFPPEPNGFLHIGHAKAICINFGMAQKYNGRCHLRFDDTNPSKEEKKYADAIEEDIKWLGFSWGDNLFHASDYFDTLYDFAIQLIKKGSAYVCELSPEEMRTYRGTLSEPGKESPFRNRTVEENLELFEKMRSGETPEGKAVLRAKIDMTSGNINMRDPVMYRVMHASHPRVGDKWKIYPMYDFTHGLSDSLENITHSLCSLEFEDHRPLYDWFIEELGLESHPQQIEFARLNINYTVLSKRMLIELVTKGFVDGWDDPRLPTIRGMRRRGYPAKAIQKFCTSVGVTKKNSIIDVTTLEEAVRDELNTTAGRAMAVVRPLKVVIENYEGEEIEVEAANHPQNPEFGSRKVSFGRELYIEQDDYMENANKKFFRLTEGREVRLRYSYIIKCREAIKNDAGEVVELRCTYDPDTLGKNPADGRKVKGIIHWVSAKNCKKATINQYDRLFLHENPAGAKEEGKTYLDYLNPDSLTVLHPCYVENSLASAKPNTSFQFERLGYFTMDESSTADALVFNRTATLRDTWAKINS